MIYKYNLGKPNCHNDYPTLIMTHGEMIKRFLTVQLQGENAVVWAEVDKTNNKENKYITIRAIWTGYEEPANMDYIGTIQEPQYGLVYHYYAQNPKEVYG